ncbi:MAG: hypothetical protein P8M71_10735 [Pseudomonadales bacterium]|nr:hypothetical protein [Pseudomonadales bacterium]
MNALKFSLSVVAIIMLVACGGSDNKKREPAYAPLVGITFPPAIATTTSDSLTVHAIALGLSNPLTTVAASLNDVAVDPPALPNAKHRYQFDITSMTVGSQNTIKVTASDANISQSTTHGVTYGASWMVERGVQYDAINDRALVVDAAKKAILAINLTTGEKNELSSLDVGSGANLAVPEDMALDGSDSVWVVDSGLQQLVKINLSNGQRSAFYDGGQSDSENKFNQPIAVALNGDATTPATIAFVLDVKNKKIHQINLTDGTDAGDPLLFSDSVLNLNLVLPRDLVYDAINDRLLVTDRGINSLVAISMSGGSEISRAILSGPVTPDIEIPFLAVQNISLNADNTKAYISDAGRAAIIEVDLNDGGRTLLADEDEVGGDDTVIRPANTDNSFASPSALTIGPNNQLLVVDNSLGVMAKVATEDSSGDLDYKGQRDYVAAGATTPAEGDTAATLTALAADHLMGRLSGLASNANQSVLYTIDRDLGEVKQLAPALNAVVPMYDLISNTILGGNGELRFSDSGLLAALSSVNNSEEDGTYADINSTGGSGSDAVFELTVNNGEVTAIKVTTAGEAYAYGDTLTLGLSGDTDFSSLSLTLVNDVVQLTDPRTIASRFGVKLGPSGQLYAQSDWLLISISASSLSNLTEGVSSNIVAESNMNGAGAKFTITVNDEQQINSIEVNAAGSGYTNGEALTFNGEDFGASGSFTLKLQEVLQDIYIVDAASEDGQGSVIQITATGVNEGNRTLLPSPSSSDTDFIDPVTALVLGETLYVLDSSGRMITVSLNEDSLGNRSLLALIPDARAMVLDETGDSFYVATNEAIKKINIEDGSVSPHLSLVNAVDIADLLLDTGELFDKNGDLDTNDDRLLLLDAGLGKVFGIADTSSLDLTSETPITGPTIPNSANSFIAPSKMAYDSNSQWLYVLDDTLRSLFVVDLQARDYDDGGAQVDAQKVVIMQGTALNQ